MRLVLLNAAPRGVALKAASSFTSSIQVIICLHMKIKEIQRYKAHLYKIAARYQVKKIYVFGSVARGESNKISDLDLLIELDENASAYGVGGFQYDVQKLLGVEIDVIPTFVLSRITDREFVQSIQAEAIAL